MQGAGTGETAAPGPEVPLVGPEEVKVALYEEAKRGPGRQAPENGRLGSVKAEITATVSDAEGGAEGKRCMGCGYCFDCGNCWKFCQDNAVIKPLAKGQLYKFKMEFCNGC